ncbi:FRG domain-containing protein [Listeria booriae]|uniref:FRG domain-containing protein n=1 Tax=Listeria booriae TaxID=1552123 RepID=UPI0016269342|nr:FRG domain-containing protein [Listeria booriae]MBC1890886.1 FRG domain-containing protein [Listeria booriae]MBC1911294.1 FRG domain-containing protein [Listeria booriae]MBC2364297.1 FRG domain-containing protein [Listeria booriae]
MRVNNNYIEEVFEEVQFKGDINDFFNDFSPNGKYKFLFEGFVYRGERSDQFKLLLPSSLRRNNSEKLANFSGNYESGVYSIMNIQTYEYDALLKFYELGNKKGIPLPVSNILSELNYFGLPFSRAEYIIGDKWLPEDLFEISALAQHYGVPTRLIDWSHSFYTAIYFAVSGYLKARDFSIENIVIYALNVKEVRWAIHNFDMMANGQKTDKFPLRFITPQNYLNENATRQTGLLTTWVEDSKKSSYSRGSKEAVLYFSECYDLESYSFEKMLLHHLQDKKITALRGSGTEDPLLLFKFKIPSTIILSLYDYLIKMGYGADNLFDGYEGIIQRLQDDTNYAIYKKFNSV